MAYYSQLAAQEIACIILIGFFLGAIPSGFIIGKLWGVDVRKGGSGNIGATNVNRMAGKTAGILTLVLDVFKGVFATYAPGLVMNPQMIAHWSEVAGVCAIVGHCFSPFMGGKGGKGVATSLGVFLSIAPLATWLSMPIFGLVVALTRYVSLASLIAVWSLVGMIGFNLLGPYPKEVLWSDTAVAVLITSRHSDNINRLRVGIENKI